MVELHDLLDQWKEKIENRAHIMRDEAPMKSHMAVVHEQGEVENNRAQPDVKIKSHFEEKMTTIESYWEDLNEQMENGYKNTRLTISLLRRIEGLLEKLAGSARDKLEARFCGLRAEAETLMENLLIQLVSSTC
ncbi:hypothetical protein QVD17_04188 [Tagetes erecta]|uniref:Uncharacterized protein n=1 Tax=Tagetes erecta TaxID=13708 RepID=A0AAD8L9Q7_TARER|nr:hypothetical protein QVD17_04188 [Tagetes erecta]